MRQTLCAFAIVAAILACASTSVRAQTTAVGPYYATPSWDQKFTCATPATCSRFVVLANWDSQAVLDRETGLVWERQPNTSPFGDPQSWASAQSGCAQKITGGRRGWRLPTVEELTSLNDETGDLPAGHPFLNVRTFNPPALMFSLYWSTTQDRAFPQFAFVVGFGGGSVSENLITDSNFYWCVRGSGGTSY